MEMLGRKERVAMEKDGDVGEEGKSCYREGREMLWRKEGVAIEKEGRCYCNV
jgi:hypothetical protein